jgi:hydrogenase expression/formation protein HypC
MCLGVPARVMEKFDYNIALVDVQGNRLKISIALVPEVEIGQYVMLHAGFAMQIIAEENAVESYRLWDEINRGQELKI